MRRVFKNFVSALTGDVIRRLIGFVAVTYLARKLGTSGFGIVTVAYAVLAYATMASAAGLHSLAVRRTAQGGENEIIGDIIVIRLILAALVWSITAAGTMIFVSDLSMRWLIMLFTLTVFSQAVTFDWFFQGKEEMAKIAAARTISGCIYLAVVLAGVRSMNSILWVGLGLLAGDLAAAVFLMRAMFQREDFRALHILPARWSALMKSGLEIGVGSALGSFSINLAPILIAYLVSTSEVGRFSAATRLVFFLLMLDRVLGTLLLPAATRLHAFTPHGLAVQLTKALKWVLLCTLPIALGGSLLARKLILIVFGSQFASSWLVLRIGIWYVVITMVHTVFTSGLIAMGHERLYRKTMIFSFVLYAASLAVGIKFFGAEGAAASIVFAELCTVLLMRKGLEAFVHLSLPDSLLYIVLSTAAMGFVVLLLSAQPLLLTVFLAVCVYAVLLFLTRATTLEEVIGLVRQR
jgi:O-antigen/teichoic acid export membrane protein